MPTKRVRMFRDTAGVWHAAATRPAKSFRVGLVKITILIEWLPKKGENIYWIQTSGVPSLATLTAIAHDFDAAYLGAYGNLQSQDTALVSTVAQDWSAAGGNFYTLEHIPPIAGTRPVPMNKFDDAVYIKQFSDVSTRGGTGYKRIMGVPDEDIINGQLTDTALGNWETGTTNFYTEIITTKSYNLVNVHFFDDNVALNPPPVYTVLTHGVDQLIHHQSSRAAYRSS